MCVYTHTHTHTHTHTLLGINLTKDGNGTSLVVQWLGLGVFPSCGLGSTPGRGTKILQAV